MRDLSRGASIAILSFVAAAIVAAEIIITRLLSVAAWYSLAFVVLSLAMLGVTRGALVAFRARAAGEPLRPWIARRLLLFAGTLVLATVVIATVPIIFEANLTAFASILLVAASTAAPMVAGGAIVARLMAESDVPLPLLYGADLAAAAVGALVPLALLGPVSGPSAMIVLALLAALLAAAAGDRPMRFAGIAAAVAALAILLVTERTQFGLALRYFKSKPRREASRFIFERWNPISSVIVPDFTTHPAATLLWSASPVAPTDPRRSALAIIDGDAGTLIYPYIDLKEIEFLRFDATSSAHYLRPDGTACVIGVGGGRDLASALVHGHDRVIGVEVNPALIEMLHTFANVSPIVRDPRVTVVEGDGRTIFAGMGALRCRVLQASLVDTWAATGAGAFAHTETTLYTREAWSTFLRRVEPDGIVTFSRWYAPQFPEETVRLVSLAAASLLDRGVSDPSRHIALVGSGAVATILVSPAPFSQADLRALHYLDAELKFEVLLAPDRASSRSLLDRTVAARSVDALADIGRTVHLDASAPTDDRPFFFQIVDQRIWLHPIAAIRDLTSRGPSAAGNATAMAQLLATALAVAAIAAWLLGPTLLGAARRNERILPGFAASAYFGALGAGFMIAEIALVQRMHVVLGHPTYALIIVLAGLLVATGLGSALSPSLIRSRRAVSVAALIAAILLALLPRVVIAPLARATADGSFPLRAAWTGGSAALVGLVLGMFFPGGIRFVDREKATPLALAINGVTSVLGTVVAVLVSVSLGITATFTVAAACYAIAAVAGPVTWTEGPNRA